jgi:hypothetical protein
VVWWIWAPLALAAALICVLLFDRQLWPYLLASLAVAITAAEQIGRYLVSAPAPGDMPSPAQKLTLLAVVLAVDVAALLAVVLAARRRDIAPRGALARRAYSVVASLGVVLLAYLASFYWLATAGA